MRIGLDASRIGGQRGMDRYMREIVMAFSQLNHDDEYVLFGPPEISALVGTFDARFRFENSRHRFRMTHSRFGKYVFGPRFRDIDVFHFPTNDVWYSKFGKTVVTLHDVIPARYSGWCFEEEREKAAYFSHLGQISRNADFIVTDSEHQKREIVELMGVSADRVIPVHLACTSSLGPRSLNGRETPSHYQGAKPFLLFVGSFEKRKNLDNVLSAFAQCAAASSDLNLVVVAAETRYAGVNDSRQKAQDLGLKSDKVTFRSGIDDSELAWLYRNTIALIYPSFDEGFGLPALEAMSFGTPVVASDIPVFREILGDAALLVDPYDVNALRTAMLALCTDETLRSRCQTRGHALVKTYSWAATANQLREVYVRALSI